MGQYWTLFNLDAHENITPSGPKLAEIILNRSFDPVVGMLAIPVGYSLSRPKLSPREESKKVSNTTDFADPDTTMKTPYPPPSTGAFSALPMPIVFLIYSALFPSLPTFIKLSMTNSAMFRIGHELVQHYYLVLTPRWAAQRLVTFGDYASYSDFPEGVFLPEESAEIEALMKQEESELEKGKKEREGKQSLKKEQKEREEAANNGEGSKKEDPENAEIPEGVQELIAQLEADNDPLAELNPTILEEAFETSSLKGPFKIGEFPEELQQFGGERFHNLMKMLGRGSSFTLNDDPGGFRLYDYLTKKSHPPAQMETTQVAEGKWICRPMISFAFDKKMMDTLEEEVPEFKKGSLQRENIEVLLQNNTHYNIPHPSGDDQTPEPWVLANLTTMEYIRADAFTNDLSNGPFIPVGGDNKVTFGDILIARFCWSSDSSLNIPNYEGWVHRGEWAGHRFIIIPLSMLPLGENFMFHGLRKAFVGAEGEGELEWKDVSKDAVRDVVELYEAIYGEIWHTSTVEELGKVDLWERLVPKMYI